MSKMSETEKAMAKQAEILNKKWQDLFSTDVAKTLRGIKQISFIGTGTSYHCALWTHWLALRFGKGAIKTRAISSYDFLLEQEAAKIKHAKNHLFVVISHRGYKSLTKRALDSIKNQKAILVTGENAPSGKFPVVYTSPQEISNAHTMSLIGAMGACSEIIAKLCSVAEAKRLRSQRGLCAKLLGNLTFLQASTQSFGALLRPGFGAHVVGGGPFHAIAMEIALKAQEIAQIPALAHNTEALLHGPLTAIDERDEVILLGALHQPTGKTSKLLLSERLSKCKAAAETIGALVIEPSWDNSFKTAAKKLSLSWQALIVLQWGQVLCLSYAKASGINPDLNRKNDPRYEEASRLSEL